MLPTLLCLLALAPATAAAAYYLLLTAVGRRPTPLSGRSPTHRIAVLVPAYNEELSLSATLDTVFAADYPPDLRPVFVVADNCSDRTAEVARSAGAWAIERHDPDRRGKGYALAFALARILPTCPDAVLILDADGALDPRAFRAFDESLTAGADVIQSAVLSRNVDDGPAGFVSALGADLDTATAAGKDRLGLPVPLRGTGMCFRREVLERFPWNAYGLTEDAEYADRLTAAGVRVRFDGRAVVHGETPDNTAALRKQRQRWRAAVAGGNPLRWAESKPLVLLQLALAGLTVVACGPWLSDVARLGFAAWAFGLGLVTTGVYLRAVLRVGLTAGRVWSLLSAPVVVGQLLAVTLGGFVRQEQAWVRTRRNAERQPVG